jgi:hypothetical protein
MDGDALSRAPSARTVARLMTVGRDHLSKSESVTIAAIEAGVPSLVEAREIITAFQAMIRKKIVADLEPWLERARSSLIASFASGVIKDRAAVVAAISSPWSNGQTEGQITKLKLVKRQMYGRGKLDLSRPASSAPHSASPPNVRQSQICTPNDSDASRRRRDCIHKTLRQAFTHRHSWHSSCADERFWSAPGPHRDGNWGQF